MPHFMFNVLNHIHVLMQSDVDLASSLLIKYSDILRYQLYNTKTELISIKQEVDFLINFIDVEMIRWNDNLNVTCSWKIENNEKKIVPLLLIIFIENAFKYAPHDDFEKGFINIKFIQKGETISLEVVNSKSVITLEKMQIQDWG